MAWVRLSDDFYDHPKFDQAGALGIALFSAGLAWCNRNLTDGFIPKKTALRLLDFEDVVDAMRNADRNGVTNSVSNGEDNDALALAMARTAVRKLVEAGLWEEIDGGYQVHDYLDYQASREQVEAGRKDAAARQKAWRERRKAENRNADRNGVTNGESNGTVTGAPNPNPNGVPSEHPPLSSPPEPSGRSNTSESARSAREKDKDPPRFSEFWSAYPRRVGKGQARKAFRAATAKVDPDTIISAAATLAQQRTGADPKYTPYPATWLNREGWLDEPDPPSPPPQISPGNRQQQTDDMFTRAMERARAKDQEEQEWTGPKPLPSFGT
ncbi:hypothetical protein FHX37_4212 [Haloactinospora alba]|uniref:DUF1376 domain-containing protein n=1 Tax=Haloactinospora alba TaxID=405555 RepID=A0A543N6N1_9ACTN|nr:hypothetical protein FHX37_4212 [Haloactinospora alba]